MVPREREQSRLRDREIRHISNKQRTNGQIRKKKKEKSDARTNGITVETLTDRTIGIKDSGGSETPWRFFFF